MSESLTDFEIPRRLRRGHRPSLYVIARQAPVPWLRVRRLGEADRPALLAHLRILAAAERPHRGRARHDGDALALRLAKLDFTRVITVGAIAGNAIIAAACGVPGLGGLEIGLTEDPGYLQQGLGDMLVSQVLDAQTASLSLVPGAVEADRGLIHLVRSLGGRVTQEAEATGTA